MFCATPANHLDWREHTKSKTQCYKHHIFCADYVCALITFILSLLKEGKRGIKFETTDVESQLCNFIFHFSVSAPPSISPPSFPSRTLQNSLKLSLCHIFCIYSERVPDKKQGCLGRQECSDILGRSVIVKLC